MATGSDRANALASDCTIEPLLGSPSRRSFGVDSNLSFFTAAATKNKESRTSPHASPPQSLHSFLLLYNMADGKRAALLLRKQLKELQKNPVEGFSAGLEDDNIMKWEVMIVGPTDTLYEGGFFNCTLEFPNEYPDLPPVMRFVTPIWHPNVYADGKVCISILHPPGDDEYGYEKASERWTPIHTVETILISVISMLSDPNDESPANLEAAKQWREDKAGFKKKGLK